MKLSNFPTIILLRETLIFTCTKQLTVKLLACPLWNWLFQPLTLNNRSKTAMQWLLIRFYTWLHKHFIPCVCTKFQTKKLNYKTHFPIRHLCVVSLYPVTTTTFSDEGNLWNNSGSTCMWKRSHFSMLFQSLVPRHLQEVCQKWTLLVVLPFLLRRFDMTRFEMIKQHGICKG